jgi:hypothetical protein
MVSSSRNKPTGQNAGVPAAPPPTMATTTLPGGVKQKYYANPAELPAAGGLVRPVAGKGMMQGAGLNFMKPPPPPLPPPPSREMLTQQIAPRGRWAEGQRGMGGAYGNGVGQGGQRGLW